MKAQYSIAGMTKGIVLGTDHGAYLKAHPFLKTLVLGISGGQDSTLTGKLAQMAVSELRHETGDKEYTFIAVRLPYGKQADEQDCQDVPSAPVAVWLVVLRPRR
ncbi:hypothetical protein CRX72_16315 [Pantoea sp. BRM17]|nr:hypothetical protein CRX72_16315 [Pantoea sp. BRM17]